MSERRILLTATLGRQAQCICEVDVPQAECLLKLFEQPQPLRIESYQKLGRLMQDIAKAYTLKGKAIPQNSGISFNYVTPSGLHAQLPILIPYRAARYYLICGGIEITTKSDAGIETLKRDLEGFISGLSPKTVAHPFLAAEGFTVKNG